MIAPYRLELYGMKSFDEHPSCRLADGPKLKRLSQVRGLKTTLAEWCRDQITE